MNHDLIKKFLKYTYSIKRIKVGNKFKRGLILNGEMYQYPKDKNFIVIRAFNDIENFYYIPRNEISSILKEFFT